MATSYQDVSLSRAFAFTCAMCHYFGLLETPSPPSDVRQALVPFRPLLAGSINYHSVPSSPSSATYEFDGGWIDAAKHHGAPKSGTIQIGFVWLHRLVVALVLQVATIASDVVSLKDRITAAEGTQLSTSVRGQETETLAQQVNAMYEQVASQEDHIAVLELSHLTETESYKRTIQELTVKLGDGKKSYDDALANLAQSLKNLQQSIDCQGARVTGVKADIARKIALLRSELADVREELAVVKTVAMPINSAPTSPAAKEARKARILTSIAQQKSGEGDGTGNLCPLPLVVTRSSVHATASRGITRASTSPGGSPITSSKYVTGKTEETLVRNAIKIIKEHLTIAHANVTQPDTNNISAKHIIPTPTIPMGRLISTTSNGKENRSRNTSTTTIQDTRPCAGQSPDVKWKPSTASPRVKAQGLPLKVSAPPEPLMSMLPAPRKSLLPSFYKHIAVAGGLSNEVKTADHLPRGSATQMSQQRAVEFAPIVISRPHSDSALSTLVGKQASAALPASSSLAALDAALQATWAEDDYLLTITPTFNCSDDGLSFSAITSTPMLNKKTKRDHRRKQIYIPPKRENMGVKPSRSLLISASINVTESKAPSSLTALETTLQALQDQGDILTDYASGDSSFLPVIPIFKTAKPHCKRESIYVSPKRTSTAKPSRRL